MASSDGNPDTPPFTPSIANPNPKNFPDFNTGPHPAPFTHLPPSHSPAPPNGNAKAPAGASSGTSPPIHLGSDASIPPAVIRHDLDSTHEANPRLQLYPTMIAQIMSEKRKKSDRKQIQQQEQLLGRQIAVNREYICFGLERGSIRVIANDYEDTPSTYLKGHWTETLKWGVEIFNFLVMWILPSTCYHCAHGGSGVIFYDK